MTDARKFRIATAAEVDAMQGARSAERGVRCRECGCADLYVRETDRRKDGTVVRRRQCRRCGARITTREERVK